MLASQFRDPITVYAEQTPVNPANKRNRQYKLAFTDRAEISFASGAEKYGQSTQMIGKTQNFRVRFALGRYNEKQIIEFRGDYYNIISLDYDRNRQFIKIQGERLMPGSFEIVTDPEPET
jgi:SPP1 family predicted phage head-tail adaptor